MRRYILTITLQSDLCPGSGDSIAGVVDQEITHDNGVPIIPAKRIKGALRGVAKELSDWGIISQNDIHQLFGRNGEQKGSGFKIYDANLYGIPSNYFKGYSEQKIDDYECFLTQAKIYSETALLSLFTMLYTKTAILEGVVKDGSLRTIRVINKSLSFQSVIELEDDAQEKLLINCVKGLRHIGYGRTRGLGEVTCELTAESKKKEENSQVTTLSKRFFRITLQQPVMLSGNNGLYYSCTNFIPGSALLGAFAGIYIRQNNLGQVAHTDPTFARLFLREGISFGYAYPEVNQKQFLPCPAHLQRIKNTDEAIFAYNQTETMVLRKMDTFVHMEDTNLSLYEPKQEFRMHHSRPENRQIGRALNDTKKTESIKGDKGQFYYYTALSKQQQFVGQLKGKQRDIDLLISLLEKTNFTIQLGRSRTAEYGSAKVELIDGCFPTGFRKATNEKEAVIYLTTPLTQQNSLGRYEVNISELIQQFERKLGEKINIDKLYLKQTTLEGYNAKWRLPKQKHPALDAGSVFIVSTQKNVDWSLLESKQWGEETHQGCGEIQVLSKSKFSESFMCHSENIHELKTKKLDDYEWLHIAVEKHKQQLEDQQKAMADAKVFIKDNSGIFIIGQTKLYQLENIFIKNKEIEKHPLFDKLPSELVKAIQQALAMKTSEYRKYFFHIIKLEVRKYVSK